MENIILGKLGEEIALSYLKKLNYKIIDKNFRKKFGEIDIIAKSPKGILIFFEVKTLQQKNNGLLPEDEMTQAKIKKLKKICEYFALKNQNLINQPGWRIDLLAITIKNNNEYLINHYENIF
jgi:putative endonuclease